MVHIGLNGPQRRKKNRSQQRKSPRRNRQLGQFLETLEDRRLMAFQVTPVGANNANQLVSKLLATNSAVTVLPNSPTLVGADGQAGTYTDFNFLPIISAQDGILLTTGSAAMATPNDSSSAGLDLGLPGDAQLTSLIGGTTTNDANVLSFDFTVGSDIKSISFDFVFGSEEFPEFVGAFNDIFGVYLDGAQVSFDSLNRPVSVNNNFFRLNNTNPPDTLNPTVTAGKQKVSLFDVQYDGITPRLTSSVPITPGQHHIKFAIADAEDSILDSGVFISSFRASTSVTGFGNGPVTGEAPVALPDSASLIAPAPVAISVLANDIDADSVLNPATVTIVSPPAFGTTSLDPVTGVVTYTPSTKFFDTDTFSYNVRDSQGFLSNTTTVSIKNLLSSISGYKYLDSNTNGKYEPNLGEKPLANVMIYIDVNNDGRIGIGEPAALTDANGFYVIPTTLVGTYNLREVLAPGYSPSIAPGAPGAAGYSVTLAPGTVLTNRNFYNATAVDWGDAPDSYKTLASSGGPSHLYVAGYSLGARVDADAGGRPSTLAMGDDFTAFDDEDGVQLPTYVTPGQTLSIPVSVSVPVGTRNGYLHAWIDWNQNGVFDTSEKIIRGAQLASGAHRYTVTVPSTVQPGYLFARFRYGPESYMAPGGASGAGEVEDYSVPVYLPTPTPRADNLTLAQYSTNNRLNVLANDVRSSVGPIYLVNSGYPLTTDNGGTVTFRNNGTPLNRLDDYLVYSAPPRGLPGTVDPLTDHFTYRVTDGVTISAPVDVNINLTPVSTAPVAADDTQIVEIDPKNLSAPTNIYVLANDRPGTTLGVPNSKVDLFSIDTSTVDPTVGTVVINDNGTPDDRSDDYLVFTPKSGATANPTIQFTYTVVNPGATNASLSSKGQVTLDIGPASQDGNDVARLSFHVFNVTANGGIGSSPIDTAVASTPGAPVYTLTQGKEYWVGVFAKDLRSAFNFPVSGKPANGVLSPYLDISYLSKYITAVRDPNSASGIATSFAEPFKSNTANQSGKFLSEGFISQIGATTAIPYFSDPYTTTDKSLADNPLVYVKFRANQVTPSTGVRLFQADPAGDTNTPGDTNIVVTQNGSPSTDPNDFSPQTLNIDQIEYLYSNLFNIVAPTTLTNTSTALLAANTTSPTTSTSSSMSSSSATATPVVAPTSTTAPTSSYDQILAALGSTSPLATNNKSSSTTTTASPESLDAALASLFASNAKK